MVREQYRKELEQVKLNEEQMAHLVDLMTAPSVRRTRRAGRIVLVAAVLTAVLSVAALAVSPTLRQTLEDLLGGFAPYSQEVEGVSVEDQGIRVSVVKALGDESGGTAYFEIQDLTGDRLTQDTKILSYVRSDVYDPEKRTLLAEFTWNQNYGQLNEDGTITVPICEIWGGKRFSGVPLPTELLEPDNVLKTMTAPEETSRGSDDDRIVLVPEQTPRKLEGMEEFSLSSMGFDEKGLLHIQIKVAEGWENQVPDSAFYPDIVDLHTLLENAGLINLLGQTHRLENDRYLDFTLMPAVGFNEEDNFGFLYLPKESYQGLTLTLAGWIGARDRVEGDWTLTFPFEPLPARTAEVNQEVNTKRIETATYSARSITLRLVLTNDRRGDLVCLPLTVYLSDGTHVTVERGRSTHSYRDKEPYYLDTWTFPEPIDPAAVTAFSIGYWYIPLQGDLAQPGHWLTQLPD